MKKLPHHIHRYTREDHGLGSETLRRMGVEPRRIRVIAACYQEDCHAEGSYATVMGLSAVEIGPKVFPEWLTVVDSQKPEVLP